MSTTIITEQDLFVEYVATAGQTDFVFPFQVFAGADDIVVKRDDVATTAFSIVLVGDEGGRVVLDSACVAGEVVSLERVLPIERITQFPTAGPVSMASVNDEFNRIVGLVQQNDDAIERSLRLPAGSGSGSLPDSDERADTFLSFDADGNMDLKSAEEAAAALDPYLTGLVGDPGGNVMSIGAFADASGLTIDAGTNLVQTSSYASGGIHGAARYVYDSTVDAAYVAVNPRSSFISANGRGFKLAEFMVNPAMFGAVPHDPSAVVNSTAAVQAFFDYFQSAENVRNCIGDMGASWAINDTIWANYSEANADALGPRIIAGELRVMPLADLATPGTPLDYVLEIVGFEQRWSGEVEIYPSGTAKWSANTTYTDRRFKNGVRIRCANGSVFGGFRVYDAMRDCVLLYSDGGSFTVRSGTDYERTYTSSNSIGVDLGPISGRTFGSQHKSSAKYGLTTTVSAKAHGTNSGVWVLGGGGNSLFQRTRLTVGSTANMEVGDGGRMRQEISAATFGTAAFDATAKTITWSAGDPVVDCGMAVGDFYYVENSDASTTNEDIAFRITGFSGGSNRVIAVSPHVDPGIAAMATQAARATLTFCTAWSFHTVKAIVDSVTMEVYPFVTNRLNSSWYHICGSALRIEGADAAWVTCPSVTNLLGAISLSYNGLYGPEIGMVGLDFGEVGIRVGTGGSSSSMLGLTVHAAHLEAATWPVLIHTTGFNGRIGGKSALQMEGVLIEGPKTANTDLERGSGTIVSGTYETLDEHVVATFQTRYEGTHGSGGSVYTGDGAYYLSNKTRYRKRAIHTDTATVEVRYDEQVAATFAERHTAELVWTDADGTAPDGTLTLNLHQPLIDEGWQFVGALSGTSAAIGPAPGTHVVLRFFFLHSIKRVCVVRTNGV